MEKYIGILLLLIAQISFAQNNSGVFLNSQDYKSNKLNYEINCDSSPSKIKLNDFFSKNYVEVTHNGNKIKLSKDSIFGYRDCKQKDFRFFKEHDKEYQIVESKTIVIYLTYVSVPTSSGKTNELVPVYFFSTTINSAIVPLTISNLKKSFPGNLKLHDKLDVEFSSNKELAAFDSVNKMYKVNYILSETTNN